MVRTYWLVPGFNEASGNLDLQPFARTDHVEACRPRAILVYSCLIDCTGVRVGCLHERDRVRRDRGRRRGPGRGLRRPTRRRRALRSRSSRRTWSAASAPTTPACPRRRCCAPASCSAEARRVPGVAEAVNGELDPQAILDRRDEVIHDLDDSGQLPWLEEQGDRPLPRRGAARRRAPGGRRRDRPDAPARPSSSPPAALRRCRRSTASTRVDAWNNREGTTAKRVPAQHDRARRRPGRLRALPGLVLARHQGDADRGRRAASSPARSRSPESRSPTALREEHGVDVRTGVKAERVSRRRRRDRGRARRRQLGSRPTSCWSRSAAGRAPTRSDSIPSASSRARTASSRPTTACGSGVSDWLYAVGDVNGRALFTHMGKYQAWVAAENMLGRQVEVDAEGNRLTAGHLHRPPGRRSRQDPRPGGRRRASTRARSRSPPTAAPGQASRARTPAAPRRIVVDRGNRDDRRRHLHGLRDRRLPAGRDHRNRRRGAAPPPAPRRRRLSLQKRDLAEASGEVRSWRNRQLAPHRSDGAPAPLVRTSRRRRLLSVRSRGAEPPSVQRAAEVPEGADDRYTLERPFRSSRTSCGKPGT